MYIQMIDNKEILRDDDIIKTEDGLVFNPYNSQNVKITLSEVQSILSKYGLPLQSIILRFMNVPLFIVLTLNDLALKIFNKI
jgi:hypothetical protein